MSSDGGGNGQQPPTDQTLNLLGFNLPKPKNLGLVSNVSDYISKQAGGTALGEFERNRQANTAAVYQRVPTEAKPYVKTVLDLAAPDISGTIDKYSATESRDTPIDQKKAAEKTAQEAADKVAADLLAAENLNTARAAGATARDAALMRQRRRAGLSSGTRGTILTSPGGAPTIGGGYQGKTLLGQ